MAILSVTNFIFLIHALSIVSFPPLITAPLFQPSQSEPTNTKPHNNIIILSTTTLHSTKTTRYFELAPLNSYPTYSLKMSLAEYKSQLEDVNALLSSSPEDESFIQLKDDLLELIELTTQEEGGSQDSSRRSRSQQEPTSTSYSSKAATSTQDHDIAPDQDQTGTDTEKPAADAVAAKFDKKTQKKLKKAFEVPESLLPLESDTEAQRNKKYRAVKKLKSQFRASQKEYESTKKQSAWLDFSKKKRKKDKSGSIFKTADNGGKVGVVTTSSGPTTSSSTSKRQKHTF